MRASLPVLHDNLRIASPCDQSWEAMRGGDQRRFCDACEKNVYDVSQMSPEALVALIEETEGKFCGRLYQRPDGKVITEDCPVGVERLRRAALRAKGAAWAAAALAVSMIASGVSALLGDEPDAPVKPLPKIIKKVEAKVNDKVPVEPVERIELYELGDVAIEPELER